MAAQSDEREFVDILSADPSEYPEVLLSVIVDTEAGRAGELSESAFQIIENGVERAVESFSFTSTTADIVFVFDDTGSMGDEISAMKSGVKSLTTEIESAGIDARYSLVTVKDDFEINRRFTADADRLKRTVDRLAPAGGGDAPEDNFDAIVRALEMDYRPSAQKVLVDITDSTSHYAGDGSGRSDYTLDEVAARIENRGVAYVAIAPDIDDDRASKKTLAQTTDGLWIDLASADFSRILRRIRRLVATAYVIVYITETRPGESRSVSCRVEDPNRGFGIDSTSVNVPSDISGRTRVFRILSTTEDAEVYYQFTVAGEVEKTTVGENGISADNDDTIVSTEDGIVTVEGSTGDGAGDAYSLTGELRSFERTRGESGVRLFLGDEEITDEYIDEPDTFEIISTDSDSEFTYEFVVEGDVRRARTSEEITSIGEDNDQISESRDGRITVSGETGNLEGDAFEVTGDIVSFRKTSGESGFELRRNGETVTAELTTGADETEGSDESGTRFTFAIVSTTEDAELTYQFLVDGEVQRTEVSPDITSLDEDNDSISEDDERVSVTGETGNEKGDAYTVNGEIISFEKQSGESEFRLERDGRDVTDEFT
ncbi:vWA domain-containing protein [Haloarcula nitratireducens]|uniref:VWA domain-containing protein n=1 Tax=Haloarcula nitratireducens TaxID=2487749 RepID=A0AAW4PBX0_9EURY|nr:vWA domain-containing protein [Halomicroarcula nitratireducens]MBX0295218.1 VWA domain-containing protein [Halomicroarcula nitratireducens]